MFKIPVKTDNMAMEMKHDFNREYADEIYRAAKRAKYKNALEIGSAWGISTLAILCASDSGHLTSVDVNPDVEAIREVPANGFSERWTFINTSSQEFVKDNNSEYDFIYIDGDHRYNGIRHDISQLWPMLAKGGLMIIDDAIHKKNNYVDKDGQSVEYGISLAILEHAFEHKLKILTDKRAAGFKK